jgi:hypothetical protein
MKSSASGTPVPNEGYWVCWDTIDNGACDTMWWPNGGVTTRPVAGLEPGTYYWQARAGASFYEVCVDIPGAWPEEDSADSVKNDRRSGPPGPGPRPCGRLPRARLLL